MTKITLLMTSWAALAGMTVHADPGEPASSASSSAATAAVEGCASPDVPSDPFAVALAIMDGGASAGDNTGAEAFPEVLPPMVDCLQAGEHGSVPSAQLAEGKVSSFRIGAGGVDAITVSEDGGLWVGVTAVDTHVIEIAENGGATPGTYTLIDYEGAIKGAGFSGLVLRGNGNLRAELVNNTAETKIELVVSEASVPESAGAGNAGGSKLRALFGKIGAYLRNNETAGRNQGIWGLLGSAAKDSERNALQ